MRTLSRCLITALAAGCLTVTVAAAGTPATAAQADSSGVSFAAPRPVPEAAPDPCDVDWAKLVAPSDSATLGEAIAACAESYAERDPESWLQAPPKLPEEQGNLTTVPGTGAGTGTGTGGTDSVAAPTVRDDWTGADAADWDDDFACDLAEIFDEPTWCRTTP